MFNISSPMHSIFWPKQQIYLKQAGLIILGSLLLSISAQLSIPLQPIPLTFQSASVILLALIYGARLATASVASYLLAGACGLPVFADFHHGISVFMGPSAGYLGGFLPAAFITGYLAEKGFAKTIPLSFLAACVGAVIVFSFGISVLAKFTGWHNAWILGFKPFWFTELIKLAVIAVFVPFCWARKAHAN